MKELEIYIDGSSKGNPGPSGIGVIICQAGETIRNISSFIGDTTNNVAEYTALIYALQEALKLRAQILTINTDSQLLFRQLKKLYKVKNQNLAGLYNQSLHLLSSFKRVSINNIPRKDNQGADKLATQAIKKQLKKECSFVTGQAGSGCPHSFEKQWGRKVRAPEDSAMGNAHPSNLMFGEDKSHRDESPAALLRKAK